MLRRSLPIALLLSLSLGCSDGSDDIESTENEQLLSAAYDLDDAAAEMLCLDMTERSRDFTMGEAGRHLSCALGAATYALGEQDAAGCQGVYDNCEYNPEPGCAPEQITKFQNCSATIGLFNRCLNEQLAALERASELELTCDDPEGYFEQISEASQPPEMSACMELGTECPALVEN